MYSGKVVIIEKVRGEKESKWVRKKKTGGEDDSSCRERVVEVFYTVERGK
jgi:hypothetical protein